MLVSFHIFRFFIGFELDPPRLFVLLPLNNKDWEEYLAIGLKLLHKKLLLAVLGWLTKRSIVINRPEHLKYKTSAFLGRYNLPGNNRCPPVATTSTLPTTYTFHC